jgi:polysaccharide deacetylase 2 family uncharacterized protein YibQ
MKKVLDDFMQSFIFAVLVFIVFFIIFDLLSSKDTNISNYKLVDISTNISTNNIDNIQDFNVSDEVDDELDINQSDYINNSLKYIKQLDFIVEDENDSNTILNSTQNNLTNIDNNQVNNLTHKKITNNIDTSTKPKLVIIVDDVMFAYQVSFIKKINLNLTPSFLTSIKTKQIAYSLSSKFKHYMIHLPLEAFTNDAVEANTITTLSNEDFIVKQINKARYFFPKAKYLNNHTGSKFTSDLKSMKLLYKILKNNNLNFLDSLTTTHSKAKIVFGDKVLVRDIFLDNKEDEKYILHQIKKAINIAKIKKLAIAICHPKKTTLRVLKKYSGYINKHVEVVFINNI